MEVLSVVLLCLLVIVLALTLVVIAFVFLLAVRELNGGPYDAYWRQMKHEARSPCVPDKVPVGFRTE